MAKLPEYGPIDGVLGEPAYAEMQHFKQKCNIVIKLKPTSLPGSFPTQENDRLAGIAHGPAASKRRPSSHLRQIRLSPDA
jgi:hypothetical protein